MVSEGIAFLLGFIALMLLMFVVWVYQGGPARYEREHPGAYVTSPAPLGTEESFGTLLHPYNDSNAKPLK